MLQTETQSVKGTLENFFPTFICAKPFSSETRLHLLT